MVLGNSLVFWYKVKTMHKILVCLCISFGGVCLYWIYFICENIGEKINFLVTYRKKSLYYKMCGQILERSDQECF